MSLQRPNPSGPSLGALLSAVLSVLLSLIVAALIGSRVGDDYQTRALVYVSLLLWSVVGAGVLLYLTRRSTSRPTLKNSSLDGFKLAVAVDGRGRCGPPENGKRVNLTGH